MKKSDSQTYNESLTDTQDSNNNFNNEKARKKRQKKKNTEYKGISKQIDLNSNKNEKIGDDYEDEFIFNETSNKCSLNDEITASKKKLKKSDNSSQKLSISENCSDDEVKGSNDSDFSNTKKTGKKRRKITGKQQSLKSDDKSAKQNLNSKKENVKDNDKDFVVSSKQIKIAHSSNRKILFSEEKIETQDAISQDSDISHKDQTEVKMKGLDTTDFKKEISKKKRKRSKKKNKVTFEQHSVTSNNETPDHINGVEEMKIENSGGFNSVSSMNKNSLSQNKFYQKLQAAKFRYLNEMLYTNVGKEALSYFKDNRDEFQDYHAGYQSQVSKWPINPVDIIIQEIGQMNKQLVIADLGCGEAKIAETFPKRAVHSFDLISLKAGVTACDMANVPLPNDSVDVTVFCLSLMGTNWKDYVREGHRILKLGGVLKIAEIESRIEKLELFIKKIESYGFSLKNENLSHKMFIFLNFIKVSKKKKNNKVPDITLKPCLYKKR